MHLRGFRVRTLMMAVGAVGLLTWGAMMASRSYDYSRRAREYGAREFGWRQIAARHEDQAEFHEECVRYFAQLAGKYRRAMWRPWMHVGPDPHAPGFDLWVELERRAGRIGPDSGIASPGPAPHTADETAATRPTSDAGIG